MTNQDEEVEASWGEPEMRKVVIKEERKRRSVNAKPERTPTMTRGW